MLLVLADLRGKADAANQWLTHTEEVLAQSSQVLASALERGGDRQGLLTHSRSRLSYPASSCPEAGLRRFQPDSERNRGQPAPAGSYAAGDASDAGGNGGARSGDPITVLAGTDGGRERQPGPDRRVSRADRPVRGGGAAASTAAAAASGRSPGTDAESVHRLRRAGRFFGDLRVAALYGRGQAATGPHRRKRGAIRAEGIGWARWTAARMRSGSWSRR